MREELKDNIIKMQRRSYFWRLYISNYSVVLMILAVLHKKREGIRGYRPATPYFRNVVT